MYVYMYSWIDIYNVCVCMYICICMYVCTHVRMYVCTYVRMYICTYVCMYVYMYVLCMYVYISSFIRQADKPQHVTQWQ